MPSPRSRKTGIPGPTNNIGYTGPTERAKSSSENSQIYAPYRAPRSIPTGSLIRVTSKYNIKSARREGKTTQIKTIG
jgi:hypothetical protein